MYYSLLIFLFALVYLILCRRNIYWALYVLLAALPAYGVRFSLVGIPMTLLELMILILFPVWFIKSVFNPHLRPKSKFAGPAFLVLFFATLASFLWPSPASLKPRKKSKAWFLP